MSKERITAYLTEKANKHELSHTDIPKLTELIEGYLNQTELDKKYCIDCKFWNNCDILSPCTTCIVDVLKPNFEPKN